MEIIYKIFYKKSVVKIDLPKIDKKDQEIIKNSIESKLTKRPEIFGKPLRSSLRGFKTLRVGYYRAVFEISNKTITILAIGHRKNIYFIANKRIK